MIESDIVKVNILILGCGWVGEYFARKMQDLGHRVYATTTNIEKYRRLQDSGIFAVLCDFDKTVNRNLFPEKVDFVLNSIPAVKRLEHVQLASRFDRIKALLDQIPFQKHIFLSSIGIYPDIDGFFDEGAEIVSSGNLHVAEQKMLALSHTVVYRLGGLFGKNRVFAKYYEGKICSTGEQPANFVHIDDVVEIIWLGFNRLLSSSVYNVVAPEHPSKKEVILASAKKYEFELPLDYEDKDSFQKIVCGDQIAGELGYSFLYPSPLHF